jgi:hypothetical protein
MDADEETDEAAAGAAAGGAGAAPGGVPGVGAAGGAGATPAGATAGGQVYHLPQELVIPMPRSALVREGQNFPQGTTVGLYKLRS